MSEQPIVPDPRLTPEAPVAANAVGAGSNNFQRTVDQADRSFSGFLRGLGGLITDAMADYRRASSSASSSGVRATNPSSGATGGGYAPRAPSGQPMRTMGNVFENIGYRLGGGQPGGGNGGGDGGPSMRGMAAGMAVTGGFHMLTGYAQRTTPNILTMDRAAYQGVLNSGIGPGGYAATAQRAVSAIYGTSGTNLNVTASSIGDAASAASILNYYSGATMQNTDGTANKAWFTAQSGMYKMGYANPYMSQTQVATSLASIYSPRSNMAALQLGYQQPIGAGGVQADPLALAQNVFSRTFRGQKSVSPGTLAAALGPGGSLNANLSYLGAQAGWAPGTTQMLTGYLQQYNTAIGKGATPGQLNDLMTKASRGDKGAMSQLSQYGMGATTVQDIKNLQATKAGRTADQYGDFNSSLQDSVNLLNSFNQALSTILNDTGVGSGLATAGGFASTFPGFTNGLGALSGGYTAGRLGGGGGGVGGILGGVAGTATQLGGLALGGAAWRGGAGFLRGGLGRLGAGGLFQGMGDTFASRFGMMGLSEGAAGLGALGVIGAGLGGAYATGQLAQGISHAGPGASNGRELARTGVNIAGMAGSGALIGSMFGPEGTVVGGVIGGTVGLAQSLWDWHKDRVNTPTNPQAFSTAQTNPLNTSNGLNPGITTYGLGSGASTSTPVGGAPSGVTPAKGASTAGAGAARAAVSFVLAQVGKPYQWGATGPDAYDCSGLTQAAYKSGGVSIPRTSQAQMTIGSPVTPGAEAPGDLMFPEPGHVAMCVGGGMLVEAPHSGVNVNRRAYSPKEFPTMRRVVGGGGDSAGQNAAATGGNGATGTAAPQLVGPNGSINEVDALSTALSGKYAPPTKTQNNSAGTNNVDPQSGANLGPGAVNGKVTDKFGHSYAVPTGAKPPGTLASWINTALAIAGLPTSDASDINIIAQHESGGDPWSINLTDSNAMAGHPSEGIMQTIPSTFKSYAMAGHTDIWNPVDNIIAGAKYAIARYGSLDKVPGVVAVNAGRGYVGYKSGAWSVPEDQTAALHKGEMVVPADPASTIRDELLKNSLYSPGTGGGKSAGGVVLQFAPGSVQVTIPNATAQAANAAANQFVTAIANDPRIKQMAVGL